MTNIEPSLNQKPTFRQPEQHILGSGKKVYLYGDPKFSGTLKG